MHLDCAGKTGRQCDSEQEKKALDELYDKTLKESMPLAKKQGNRGFLWSCYAHAGAVLDGDCSLMSTSSLFPFSSSLIPNSSSL